MPHPSQQSPLGGILPFAVPIGFIVLFLIGVPLGYKLVLGGRKSTVEQGTIERVILINQIPGATLDGKKARIVSDYLIVELAQGKYLWIPETNIAGIEFQTNK